MTRLRPNRSATMPANGAASATASVDAVTTRLMRPGVTSKALASMGSSGCGAKMVRKAQNPAKTTAAVRVVERGAAVMDILFIMHGELRSLWQEARLTDSSRGTGRYDRLGSMGRVMLLALLAGIALHG